MDLLPWLLDWPPSRGAVAAFLVLTAASVGTLVAFGGVTDEITRENVTVDATDVSVRLNDEGGIPDLGEGVQTCLASGTPPDSVAVIGDVTVTVPAEGTRNYSGSGPVTVAVSLAHTDETTTETVEGSGEATRDIFWIIEDDETLSVGGTATLQVRVQSGDSTLAETTRTAPVENGTRSYDC
jgi:hypothetical protein